MKLLREQPNVFTPYQPIPTPFSRAGPGPSTIFTPPNYQPLPMFTSNIAPTPSMEPAGIDSMTANFHEQPDTPVGIFEQFIFHLGPPMVRSRSFSKLLIPCDSLKLLMWT